VTGITPDRVTTDGHDSYPQAIRTTLGKGVRHRTSAYLNNRLEQDQRGIKGRYRPYGASNAPDPPLGSVALMMNSAASSASAPATISTCLPIVRDCFTAEGP
jgi:transposase-like protein